MKRIVVLLLVIVMAFSCVSCSSKSNKVNTGINVTQTKAICELAVMECYYHNVAKYFIKDAEKGFLGIGKKDKRFWIEYDGIVKIGIDASLVSLEVSENEVSITLPEAKVLDCKVDSSTLSKDSFIVDKESAKIVADDEVKAFGESKDKLVEKASSDKALLDKAQQRAKILLEEYITNIGNAVGKNYSINWVYLDAEGNPIEQ